MTKFKIFLIAAFVSYISASEARDLPNFSDLAEQASPAVVNITSSKTVKTRNSFGRGFGDPRYDEFFERFFMVIIRFLFLNSSSCFSYFCICSRRAICDLILGSLPLPILLFLMYSYCSVSSYFSAATAL